MRMTASLADDAWHNLRRPGSYEWWYFDALTDDQEYGLVAIWFCGMPFSPDYNAHLEAFWKRPDDIVPPDPRDYAAFSFALYHRGRTVAYSLIEYDRRNFHASTKHPEVSLGANRFFLDPKTSTYRLQINAPTVDVTGFRPRLSERRIVADLNFTNRTPNWGKSVARFPVQSLKAEPTHVWNLVAPVCTTTGRVRLIGEDTRIEREIDFTGGGYHDHNWDEEPMLRGINRWHWGRCWSGDRLLVYYHSTPFPGEGEPFNVAAVFDGDEPRALTTRLQFKPGRQRRNWLALDYPRNLELHLPAGDGLPAHTWRVRQRKAVDSGPFYARFLSEFQLEGSARTPDFGVTELLDATRLRLRLFRPMINTRIRRPEGRTSYAPLAIRLSQAALGWLS